jgi:hypothetical protein
MPRLFGQRVSPSGPRGGIRTAVAVIPNAGCAANAVTEITCPLTGVVATDLVVANPIAAHIANIGFGTIRVVGANVLGISFPNPTGAPINSGNITMQCEIRRYPAQSAGPAAP